MSLRHLLHWIAATVTQHPRDVVELEVHPESWSSTAFRALEWVFGRRSGICRYNSVQYVDGVQHVSFFCFEALISYAESLFRQWLKNTFAFGELRVYYAQTAQGVSLPFPYYFAIARDTSTNFGGGSGTTTVTYANYPMATTATGALFFGMYGANSASDTVTAQTFNGNSMGKINNRAPTNRQGYLFYYLGATGTHDIVITFSGDPGGSDGAGFSYTGCSTSAIDDTHTSTTSGGTSLTTAPTVSASNCWLAGFFLAGDTITAGAGTSFLRTGGNYAICDSNGTVPTGVQGLTITMPSAVAVGCVASFAPAITGPTGVKTWDGIAIASVKTINGLAIGSVKTVNSTT